MAKIRKLEDIDAWVLLRVSYYNQIHHHVSKDGPAPEKDIENLMTLSTRIISEDGLGIWIATTRLIKTPGDKARPMVGRYLVPWRYVEGIHLLDEDLPDVVHEVGKKIGFEKKVGAKN